MLLCGRFANIVKKELMTTKTYTEPQSLNHVIQFHNTFDLPIVDDPSIPSPSRCALRINLIREELDELKAAIEDKDIVEVADALCDIQYVLAGAIIEFGLAEKFSDLYSEVQRSNMSKTCLSLTDAEATQDHYLMTQNTASVIEQKGNEYIVFRASDRKVLKSINYSPADLRSILEEEVG